MIRPAQFSAVAVPYHVSREEAVLYRGGCALSFGCATIATAIVIAIRSNSDHRDKFQADGPLLARMPPPVWLVALFVAEVRLVSVLVPLLNNGILAPGRARAAVRSEGAALDGASLRAGIAVHRAARVGAGVAVNCESVMMEHCLVLIDNFRLHRELSLLVNDLRCHSALRSVIKLKRTAIATIAL